MALSNKQTQLIRSTIPLLKSDGDRVSAIFYESLLAAHPDLRHIYNPTNQASRRQPRAFTAAILTFAQHAGLDTSTLAAKLERVCQKHCSLGIHPHHYAIVGDILLGAFARVLGPDVWTGEMHTAWAAAYGILSRMLIGREKTLYAQFGSWDGFRKFNVAKRVEEDHGRGDVVSFYLSPEDGGSLPQFLPGQYVTLQLWVAAAASFQSRQYALSDVYHPGHYRITIRRDRGNMAGAGPHGRELSSPPQQGSDSSSSNSSSSRPIGLGSSRPPSKDGTRGRPGVMSNLLLDHKRVGDTVEITHPAGEFYLDPANTSSLPLVLISANVGVAPLVAIVNSVANTHPDRTVSWIHAYPPAKPSRSISRFNSTHHSHGQLQDHSHHINNHYHHHHHRRRHNSAPKPALFETHVRGLASRCKNLRVSVFESDLAGADNVGGEWEERKWGSESERTKSIASWDRRTGPSGSENGPGEDVGMREEAMSLGEQEEDDVFWGIDGADLWLGNSGTEYFVCGPEAFMRGVAKSLAERGVKGSSVKFELLGTGDFHFAW